MTYPDSVRFLYSLGNEIKTAKLGLARMAELLSALGNPHSGLRFVHVAGTNGKGSVCAMIESALRAAGDRIGLFTSPHLVEPAERIQIDGSPVDRDSFARAFDQVHAAADPEEHPTYFETVTAMALLLFAERGVDRVVLEVGLGGRLDATNVVTPELCVITPIDFDHESWLGPSIESIAGEKAGILKPGIPAVFARQRPDASRVLLERAREARAPVIDAAAWRAEDTELHARGSRFTATAPEGFSWPVACSLAGEHQVDNALTAIATLHALRIPGEPIQAGLLRARWPGRLECVAERPDIILDGAHNPAGTAALVRYIERFYSGRRVWLIYGLMRDKSVQEMVEALFPLASEVILTAPASSRALRPEAIRDMASHPRLRIAATLREALALAQPAPDDAIFITGSLYLVGEARAMLVK